jgi:hypothetical protein
MAGVVCALTLADGWLNDWRVFHVAGRALVSGENPYTAVLEDPRAQYPFYYPGPGLLILAPFGLLSAGVGFITWAVVSGWLFGHAAMRYGRGLLPACLSTSFLQAVTYGQWSPLLVAGAVLPGLGWLLAAKPSIGFALFAWRPERRTVLLMIAVTLGATVVLPSWPLDWWASLQHTNHVAPVARPWGWILLLAVLRWRTPEARLLLALAIVPHTTALFETLPLFLIPRNRWESYGLVGSSYAVAVASELLAPTGSMQVEPLLEQRWPALFLGMYLPALGLVLRR